MSWFKRCSNYLGHGSFMWDDIFPNGNNPKSMHVSCCLCVPGHYAGYFLPQSACPRRDPLAEPTYLGHRLFSGTNDSCGVQLHLAHTCGLRGWWGRVFRGCWGATTVIHRQASILGWFGFIWDKSLRLRDASSTGATDPIFSNFGSIGNFSS